jgi:tetratricopeptide (TPR) repeat protein
MKYEENSLKEGGPGFCLSNPPHLVGRGEVICRQCGTLAQDTSIGSYQVKRFLRRERGSQAYLATHQGQAQPFLVKLFLPDPMSRHLWERARQEVSLLAELHHSSILPVYDCTLWYPGRAGSALTPLENSLALLVAIYQYTPVTLQYFAQNRASLSAQQGKLTLGQLIPLIEQITAALLLAHSLGTVHGALEPGNVFLNAQFDHAWVADFGLARLQLPRPPLLAPELLPVARICEQRRDIAPYWEAITEAGDQYMLAVLCTHLLGHTIPPGAFQRLLPILQRASHPEPSLRFPQIGDFCSALTAEAGIASPSWSTPDLAFTQTPTRRTPEDVPLSADSSSATPVQQANQWEHLAGKYFTSHNYEEAIQAYLQTLNLEPERISALSGLADTYFALERYTEALEIYVRVLRLDPSNAEIWFNQATVLDLLGRSEQAARSYGRAEQLRAEADRRK